LCPPSDSLDDRRPLAWNGDCHHANAL